MPLTPLTRAARARHATDLFNAGAYWEAHEALEGIWRGVDNEAEARVLQGLIQAAAALLHQARGNRHGVTSVGKKALEKLARPQHPAIEFETVGFHAALEAALRAGAAAPRLELRET